MIILSVFITMLIAIVAVVMVNRITDPLRKITEAARAVSENNFDVDLPPENDDEKDLTPIPGSPPDLLNPPKGCPFVDRCEKAMKVCKDFQPPVTDIKEGHQCACWLLDERAVKK